MNGGVCIETLAVRAVSGDAYCSSTKTELVPDVSQDTEWNSTEFFDAIID